MTEPTEIKRKPGRPPKVESETIISHLPVRVEETRNEVADITKKLHDEISDLRSRIEAIELFRNPGAIEGRIKGMGDAIDSQNAMISGLRKEINELTKKG